MPEDNDTTADDFSVASVAVEVAKDVAVTITGTVIGLSLFVGALKSVKAVSRWHAARKEQETVAHAM